MTQYGNGRYSFENLRDEHNKDLFIQIYVLQK